MRMRIIAAAVVLGLGIVGMALAQQAGQQSKDRVGEKAKLRAQVARLRAEVEFLELEHGVDANMLREIMKDVKNADLMASMKGPIKEYAKTVAERSTTETSKKAKAPVATVIGPSAVIGLEGPPEPVHVPVPDELYNMAFDESDAMARLARPAIERLKKEFVQKAAELAEKRLELAELENRYSEAR